MDKIVGTWLVDNGQRNSFFKDGTFSAQVPHMGTITGQHSFHDGHYHLESGGSILSSFQIISYGGTSMRLVLKTGEVQSCQRVDQATTFQPGDRVVLHSLNGSASLNGSNGMINSFDKASSRYFVFVEQTKGQMKIREVNLKPRNPASAASAVDPMVQQLNQYTAQLDRQNAQMLQSLSQQTAQLNQQNAQMLQSLNQQTAQLSHQNTHNLDYLNQWTDQLNQLNAQNLQQMNTAQTNQLFGGGNNVDGGGSNPWNIDPAAAGEFTGEFAGAFVQGFFGF